jgi:glycosyltransferase involved in cell wall biosynthesis
VIPVSVLVLTKNERQDMPGCLESVAWSDDVHVFDSLSTDGTQDIARDAGAKVTERAFDGYASQRNAALRGIDFKYEWVFILDADERVPEGLRDELSRALAAVSDGVAAFRLRRRDFFLGTWLKHAQISPYYIRVVRPGKVRYEREVNEVMRVDGEVVDLEQSFDHYPFSKGISHWLAKHDVYSTMEAQLVAADGGRDYSVRKAFFGPDFNERRMHQKALFYRLPFRPLIKWSYMMFVRGAILDGRAGITYSLLQAIYEYMIVLKTRELLDQAQDHRV